MRLRSSFFLMLLLAACGGSPAKLPTVQLFTASPSTLPYGGGTVTLSWSVTDADSVVIDALGSSTQKLAGSSTITVDATKTFTLTATGPGGTKTATSTVTVDTAEPIDGVVLGYDELPYEGAEVYVNGADSGATDSSGHFHATGKPPYDVTLLSRNTDTPAVVFWSHLTTASPVLLASNFATYAGTISGSMTAGSGDAVSVPPPSGHRISVSASSNESQLWHETTQASYTLPVGPTPDPAVVNAIEYAVGADGFPSGYDAYGTLMLAAPAAGATETAPTLNLTGPVDAKVVLLRKPVFSGTVTFQDRRLYLTAGNQVLFLGQGSQWPTDVDQVYVPSLSNFQNGQVEIETVGSDANGWYSTANEQVDLSVAMSNGSVMPNCPSLGGPADRASGVTTGTVFSWSGGDPGMNVVDFVVDNATDVVSYQFVTSDASVTFPDLSKLPARYQLPPAANGQWLVSVVGPAGSTDALATGDSVLQIVRGSRGPRAAYTHCQSPWRYFTTP